MSSAVPISPPSKAVVFGKRLASTLVLWGLLAGAMVFELQWPFWILVSVFGLGSLWEFLQMDSAVPRVQRGIVFLVAAAYYGALFFGNPAHWPVYDVLAGFLVVALSFVPPLFRPLEGTKTLWNVFYPIIGFFYTAWLFGFLFRIGYDPDINATGGVGLVYMLFLVAATKFTDSGAYAVGSLVGKHKMIPHISPGKTWEGLIGAFLGACGAGFGVLALGGSQMPKLQHGEVLALCLGIALLTVIGDLAESAVKRCLQLKDSGHMLPGIGGALDLTDSLLYTAPPFYLYLKYVA